MVRSDINSFVESYVQALRDQNAAVFAGAGLSIPAGLMDWKELLRDIAKEIGLDVEKEDDLVSIAQFHVNERRGRHRINQALIDGFASRAALTENHKILASLPIRIYWTTNYDQLIEESLRNARKKPDVKKTVENMAITIPRRDAIVYKMHGDISLPDKAVVTKEDYELYDSTRHLFSMALQGDLVSKTFLFLGFSFSDPNVSYVLGRIRGLLGENRRDHYCLLRRVQRSDFDRNGDFAYARAKQELQVRDLKRYGIIGILVDDYAEYTDILTRISQKYRMSKVFISGSASTYSPWTDRKAHQLIREISRQLVQEGFGVVSGFGLGVGSYVVNGILEQLDREGTRMLDDRIVLRPFPFDISDPKERKRQWTAYREEILSHAGVVVFLFGNKTDSSGNSIMADGVEEEFSMAVNKGVIVVPIGCTGSIAEKLHRQVYDDFEKYYSMRGYKGLFKELNKMGSAAQVASRVVKFIKKLREEA
jgi:hypothetical protein